MGCVANSRQAAVAAAEEAGFPCVMKLISPEVIHKSDAGVVILDIADAVSAGNSYDLILANGRRAGAQRIDGVLVQQQARPGFEVLVGARQDPIFGPLTLIGYGGRYVELFKEVAAGVGVLNREDVERMLGETVVGRIVAGFRGPALDKEALIDLAIRVSRLMAARPDVVELDLNPVILYPSGCAIVDARVILGEPAQRPCPENLGGRRWKSLQAIFNPSSVAVVGASGPGSIGGNILEASRRVPRLYPINPKRDTLLGLKCYPDFQAIGSPVDVGVFAVSPEATINSFRQFCEAGGKGAIIVSDGFAEIGRSDLEEKLHAISEQHGVAYLGPNGLGVLDNFSGLNTLFFRPERLTVNRSPGTIGVISQSGGIGTELLEMGAADNLAIGKWVSCGNASGISIAELLEHMGEDVRIRVVAVYLEGLRNGLQFMEVARRVAARKPILVIKGGMAGGAGAALSHTASLAGSFEAFRAACRQAGLYLLEELTEDPKILLNVLSILTAHEPVRSNRVAVVSLAGGPGVLLADQLTSQGMELAKFSDATQAQLTRLLESKIRAASDAEKPRIVARVVSNPLDLFGDADDDRLCTALSILNDDSNTDIIVLSLHFQAPRLTEDIAKRLVALVPRMRKPLISSMRGHAKHVQATREYLAQHGLRTYTVPMVKPLAIALDIWKRYGLDFRA
jgi:3-hydroxypropionyl-CoA synthetase (ADP-forming)